MALVRPKEMLSLWAKERWVTEESSFISNNVFSSCWDMRKTSIQSTGQPVGQSKKILRINTKCKIVQLAGLPVNVQEVNLSRLYYMWGGNVKKK